jgi:hypothetical protein
MENKVPRRISGPKGDRNEDEENYVSLINSIISTFHKILLD